MQLNVRLSGMSILVIAALIAGWLLYEKYFPTITSTVDTNIVTPEKPVVMRTPGGLLEIATVKAYERFSRSDTRQFWGIPLGTTVSQIQATVVYRYHIELAKEWTLLLNGTTCIVRTGAVKPSLPVAFDTTTMTKYSKSGWARFNSDENLDLLERSMTPELDKRAQSVQFLDLAADAGRQTIAEFVMQWLLKEQQWKRDPDYKIFVLYPGEPMPKRQQS
jgi:hypothetical protein